MPQPTVPRRSPVILIVDDEALLRMMAAEYFEEAGYEVVEAADGAATLVLLREWSDIQAVFTDVQMPGLPDGYVLARHARELCLGCAIVVVSGRQWPSPHDLVEGARFVTKPYRGHAVVRMVDGMIGQLGRSP